MPKTDLEALKKKLADFGSKLDEYPETRSVRVSLLSRRGSFYSTNITPDESRVVLAAAVNAERVERMKDALRDIASGTVMEDSGGQDMAGNWVEVPRPIDLQEARAIAAAALRELESEVG